MKFSHYLLKDIHIRPTKTDTMTDTSDTIVLTKNNAGHRIRLQQKMLERGIEAFEDYEFLELILTRAIPQRDVKPLAKELIKHFGSVPAVLYALPEDLMKFPYVKESVVCLFKIIVAASQRLTHYDLKKAPILDNWEKLEDYCLLMLSAETIEHFYILYLDTRHKLITVEEHQRGTLNHAPIYPREILKRALNLNAKALVLVHNHPSGNPEPSRADIRLTQTLDDIVSPLEISIHDHLIIGKEHQVYSFRKHNLFDLR